MTTPAGGALAFLLLLLVTVGPRRTEAQDYHRRQTRGSAGAYSGVANGQFYGGTYNSPDNGPGIFNRFGDHPSPSSSAFPSGGGLGGGLGGGGGGGGGGSFASSGAGAGAGAGAFGNGFTYAPQYPFVNFPPLHGPVDFNNFFQNYFKLLNDNLALSSRTDKPHSFSASSASLNFGDDSTDGAFSKNFAYQQAAFDAAQNAFQSTANRFGSDSYAPGAGYGGASASASLGPHGGHQSANIYPQNPASPNINNRFGNEGGPPKPGGVYGVSSSSFSASSNHGGKKTDFKEASTTINDNGKVTTYTVRN